MLSSTADERDEDDDDRRRRRKAALPPKADDEVPTAYDDDPTTLGGENAYAMDDRDRETATADRRAEAARERNLMTWRG